MLRDNSLSPAAAAAVDKRLILDVYVQHELFVHEPPVGHLLLPAHPDGAAGAGGVVPAKPGERSVVRCRHALQLCGRGFTPFSLAQVSQWQFQTNWRIFSMGQLEGLDWTGVLVAGGAVLACATTQPAKPRYGDKLLVQHLLRHSPPSALNHLDGREDCATFLALHSPESPTATSDIDLYLYGGDSAAELRAKRVKVVEQILENGRRLGVEMYATRTPAAVTVFAKYPFRSVQIIVGAKAKCAAEVGLDFDLDCCALFLDANTRLIAQGFVPVDDEARLLALPRAMLALNRRCNVLRADKNSYAKLATSRLLKYGDRGFATAITERLFIKPIVGDAHGSSLDDARTVKLLRFAKLQLLSLSVDDCGGDEWCLAGNVTPLNCLRSVLRREMKPQDDIYASAGEFCVAELIKRVLNLDDLTTYAADGVDAKEDHLAFDAQVAENLPVRRRNRYERCVERQRALLLLLAFALTASCTAMIGTPATTTPTSASCTGRLWKLKATLSPTSFRRMSSAGALPVFERWVAFPRQQLRLLVRSRYLQCCITSCLSHRCACLRNVQRSSRQHSAAGLSPRRTQRSWTWQSLLRLLLTCSTTCRPASAAMRTRVRLRSTTCASSSTQAPLPCCAPAPAPSPSTC